MEKAIDIGRYPRCSCCNEKAPVRVKGNERIGYYFEKRELLKLGWEMRTPISITEIEWWYCPICKVIN